MLEPLAIPTLLKAVDFLFDESKKILELLRRYNNVIEENFNHITARV